MTNDMGKVRPSLEEITKFINKYISLIPMCFVSWFVWLMIDDRFFADLLFVFGCWFVWPLMVWAIIVFLQSFWKKGFLWKIYLIWGCVIIILVGAYFISPAKFGNKCNPEINKVKNQALDVIKNTKYKIEVECKKIADNIKAQKLANAKNLETDVYNM